MAAVPHRLHGIRGAKFRRRLFHESTNGSDPNPLDSNQDIWRSMSELWPFVSFGDDPATAG
jgi:hypothetical protein